MITNKHKINTVINSYIYIHIYRTYVYIYTYVCRYIKTYYIYYQLHGINGEALTSQNRNLKLSQSFDQNREFFRLNPAETKPNCGEESDSAHLRGLHCTGACTLSHHCHADDGRFPTQVFGTLRAALASEQIKYLTCFFFFVFCVSRSLTAAEFLSAAAAGSFQL